MLSNVHKSYIISDRSYISIAKKEISKLADGIGFSSEQKGRIDIIVSELTSNLIKHKAINGEILVKVIKENSIAGLEILCLDNGPGMRDLKRMMEDGVSTYGSQGEGLGAIKRLSDQFDIYSQAGIGTFILSRIYIKNESPVSGLKAMPKGVRLKAVMVPKSGETFCGDEWAVIEQPDRFVIFAADGLGHGIDAHKAATEASKIFSGCVQCIPSEILRGMHNSIKKTRGIVGGIANIDLKNQTLTYCGIGNISGRLFSREGIKSLISYNGTIGHNIPNTFNNHTYNWEPSSFLVLHSDGVKQRWDLSKYVGIEKLDLSLMAGLIYKDNTRKTDDALVIVIRY